MPHRISGRRPLGFIRKVRDHIRLLGLLSAMRFAFQIGLVRKFRREVQLTTKWAKYPLLCRAKSSDRAVFRQIFLLREYSCLDEVREPSLIVDCGANVGYSSAYFLSRFPGCRLIAVEPDTGNFEILKRNMAPYGDRVTLLNAGVWSHAARLMMITEKYRDGKEWSRQVGEIPIGEALPVGESRSGEASGLRGVDIGSLLSSSGQSRISILKIDIEGAEAVVFAKNYETWIDRVDNLVIELHDDSAFGKATPIFEKAIAGRGFSRTKCGELEVCQRDCREFLRAISG